jgi:cell division protein FtsW (lipid II flippase)
LGSTTLLSIYLLLTYFGIEIVKKIKDEYARNVIIGLLMIIIFPVFYNIGSVLGNLPFSGITLTFVSKGGSSLLASLIVVGIILALSKGREKGYKKMY